MGNSKVYHPHNILKLFLFFVVAFIFSSAFIFSQTRINEKIIISPQSNPTLKSIPDSSTPYNLKIEITCQGFIIGLQVNNEWAVSDAAGYLVYTWQGFSSGFIAYRASVPNGGPAQSYSFHFKFTADDQILMDDTSKGTGLYMYGSIPDMWPVPIIDYYQVDPNPILASAGTTSGFAVIGKNRLGNSVDVPRKLTIQISPNGNVVGNGTYGYLQDQYGNQGTSLSNIPLDDANSWQISYVDDGITTNDDITLNLNASDEYGIIGTGIIKIPGNHPPVITSITKDPDKKYYKYDMAHPTTVTITAVAEDPDDNDYVTIDFNPTSSAQNKIIKARNGISTPAKSLSKKVGTVPHVSSTTATNTYSLTLNQPGKYDILIRAIDRKGLEADSTISIYCVDVQLEPKNNNAIDGSSTNYNLKITPDMATPTSIKWSGKPQQPAIDAMSDLGNPKDAPDIQFLPDSISKQVTINPVLWFANNVNPCGVDTACYYNVESKIMFDNDNFQVTDDFKAWIPDTAGITHSPIIKGYPKMVIIKDGKTGKEIGYKIVTDTVNSLERSIDSSHIEMRIPTTSRYYNKLYTHEKKHFQQWQSGIVKDYFTVDRLLTYFKGVQTRTLEEYDSTLHALENNFYDDEKARWKKNGMENKMEKEAYDTSDSLKPYYGFRNCNRFK